MSHATATFAARAPEPAPAAPEWALHPLLIPEIARAVLRWVPFAEQIELRVVCRVWAAEAPASGLAIPTERVPKTYWNGTPEELYAPWLGLMAQVARLHAAGMHSRADALLRDASAEAAWALERDGRTLLQARAARNDRPFHACEARSLFDKWCRFLHGALTALAASAPPESVLAALDAAEAFYPERVWAGPAAVDAARHGNAPAALTLLAASGLAGAPKWRAVIATDTHKWRAAAAAAACRANRVEALRALLEAAPPPPSHCHDLVWGAVQHHAWRALAEVRSHYWRRRSPSAELSLEWCFASAARWHDEVAALHVYRLPGFRPSRRARLLALRYACHGGHLTLARRLMADGLRPDDLYDDGATWTLPVHCPNAWSYYGDAPRAIQPVPLYSPTPSASCGCAWELALEAADGGKVAGWLAASYGPPDGARIRAVRARRRAAKSKPVTRNPGGGRLSRKDRRRVARGECLCWIDRNGDCSCPICD